MNSGKKALAFALTRVLEDPPRSRSRRTTAWSQDGVLLSRRSVDSEHLMRLNLRNPQLDFRGQSLARRKGGPAVKLLKRTTLK